MGGLVPYRNSLRFRITFASVMILMLCMVLLTTATLIINYYELRRGVLESREVLFNSMRRELNGTLKSAQELASYIAINESLQQLLRQRHTGRSIEDLVNSADVRALLSAYTFLSEDISAIAVLKHNDVLVTSMTNVTLSHALQALWNERYGGRTLGDVLFSDVIHVSGVNYISSDPYDVICYLKRISDKEAYNVRLGYAVLFLKYDHVVAPLRESSNAFEDVLLVNREGNVLYREGNGISDETILGLLDGSGRDVPGHILKTARLDNEDWTLIASISTFALWSAFLPAFTTGLLLTLGGMALAIFALIMTLRRATRSLNALSEGIEQVARGDLSARLAADGQDEISQIALAFNRMTDEITRLIETAARQEKEKNDYKFAALKMQINPHFLSNTLGAIICLTHQGESGKVVRLTTALLALLNDTMNWEQTHSTVAEEIRMLKAYLSMQNIRYGDIFSLNVHMYSEAPACLLPRMILQPIIENSILHGILPKEMPGVITLQFEKSGENMCVSVRDNGVGIPPEKLACLRLDGGCEHGFHENIGLRNVQDRLQILYGFKSQLHVESRYGEYTDVRFTIPLRDEERAKTEIGGEASC